MRTHLRSRLRNWRRAENLGSGTTQRQQNAHPQMRGLHLGPAAAQGLGVLQAAQRGSGGGGLVFVGVGVFLLGSAAGPCGHKTNLGVAVGRGWDARSIAVAWPSDAVYKAMLEKPPFFNGLLGGVACN